MLLPETSLVVLPTIGGCNEYLSSSLENERTYSITMNAVGKRGDSEILERLLYAGRVGNQPPCRATTRDTVAFTTYSDSCARAIISGRLDAAHRAKGLWRETIENQVMDAQP
jgi:hypothetical protein